MARGRGCPPAPCSTAEDAPRWQLLPPVSGTAPHFPPVWSVEVPVPREGLQLSQAGVPQQHHGPSEGGGHGHAAHGMVPGTPRTPDRAAAVLLPQEVEACSQDEGSDPEARQQVRGRVAPSAEPLAELGCPAPPVSAVGTDAGANGSGRSRPSARAVLGRQDKPHPGGSCLCALGSPIPQERQSFSPASRAPGRAAPIPCTRSESWHGG